MSIRKEESVELDHVRCVVSPLPSPCARPGFGGCDHTRASRETKECSVPGPRKQYGIPHERTHGGDGRVGARRGYGQCENRRGREVSPAEAWECGQKGKVTRCRGYIAGCRFKPCRSHQGKTCLNPLKRPHKRLKKGDSRERPATISKGSFNVS